LEHHQVAAAHSDTIDLHFLWALQVFQCFPSVISSTSKKQPFEASSR